MQKSTFEQMGGTYTQIGDYLIPNLEIGKPDQSPLGKNGRMRKCYLKDHRRVLYTNLLVTGKQGKHLAQIDEACEERMDLLIRQMAKQESV